MLLLVKKNMKVVMFYRNQKRYTDNLNMLYKMIRPHTWMFGGVSIGNRSLHPNTTSSAGWSWWPALTTGSGSNQPPLIWGEQSRFCVRHWAGLFRLHHLMVSTWYKLGGRPWRGARNLYPKPLTSAALYRCCEIRPFPAQGSENAPIVAPSCRCSSLLQTERQS